MPHLVLLGDSVLDNGAYTAGGPAVIAQVRQRLPAGWSASLSAVDGSTIEDIPNQLATLPAGATHLLLSVGGNDAMLRAEIVESPVASSGEALLMLADAVQAFEAAYRHAVQACLAHRLPLVVCTVYHGNFPEPTYQRRVGVALTAFNDVIVRAAIDKRLKVIDLRPSATPRTTMRIRSSRRRLAARRLPRPSCAPSRKRLTRGVGPRWSLEARGGSSLAERTFVTRSNARVLSESCFLAVATRGSRPA